MKSTCLAGRLTLILLLIGLLGGCTSLSLGASGTSSTTEVERTTIPSTESQEVPSTTEALRDPAESTGAWETCVPNLPDDDYTKRY